MTSRTVPPRISTFSRAASTARARNGLIIAINWTTGIPRVRAWSKRRTDVGGPTPLLTPSPLRPKVIAAGRGPRFRRRREVLHEADLGGDRDVNPRHPRRMRGEGVREEDRDYP